MKNLKLLFLIPLFVVGSCNTDNNSESLRQTENHLTVQNSQKLSSKITNPHEQLGILHNEFLTTMYNSNVESVDVVKASAKSFFKSKGYNTDLITNSALNTIVATSLAAPFTADGLDALSVKYNFSDAYKAELYKLVVFFNQNSYASVDEIENGLINIEEEYMNAAVSSQEKQNLLGIIVIARYSTHYWINRFPNDRPSFVAKGKWFARIFGGIIGDVVGAAVGGAIGGAVGGPVGAAIGIGLGAAAVSGAVQIEITKDENAS
ncbi:hypothetical protein F3J23_11945 [Chryseobacterium sp. Tr-659]|uniref:hypothetical protein n=1 Tax=Chryseobacterium sp. Tr-659 TaxID=2608340 RepID=UPI00141EBDEC|nr:hypothetical protein [Chryseobacterium sp. Tr-659]NIF06153.1 hypothetical protein [Chryseobacterium sp. Tr-659]